VKKQGILNAPLSAAIARLGHMQWVMVTDCGMPLPYGQGVPIVDLAVVKGEPRLCGVLDALLGDVEVEASAAAVEAQGGPVEKWLRERGLAPAWLPHDELKAMLPGCALVVRSGEATPFANVALRCGVTF
jgi:D-ribose pyranase